MEELDHVAIVVADIDKALAWYREFFDVRTLHADGSWVLLQFSNIRLALVSPGQHPPHLAVQRSDAESHGPLNRHRDGTMSVYTRDPWGNEIEVMKPGKREDEK